MQQGIYKIANKITGDFYIGSAVNYERRISVHKNHLKNGKHHNPYLQHIFNKYGIDNLSFELIKHVKLKEDLIKIEQEYLDKLNPKYNIRTIADSNLGIKYSEKAKQKISNSRKGQRLKEETKIKISNTLKGRKISKETILKMSNKKISEETKNKMSKNNAKYWLGKSRSPESIRKMSQSHKGKSLSELHKKSLSKSLKDKGTKEFKLISPTGELFEGKNISTFCREQNLSVSHISQVLNNKRSHHKGWTKA